MSIDLDAIESRIATGIYGDDRLSKKERDDAFSALAEIIAEVSALRQTLDATEKERDQWHDAALDLDAIDPWSVSPDEAAALVAEVERLRAEVDAERAAVVAWLCAWQGQMDDRITHDDADYAISVIERGEHRREEKP